MSSPKIFPVDYTQVADCLTYNARAPLPVLRPCAICPCGWSTENALNNCNLCGSDSSFYQLYKVGDTLPVQFVFEDYLNPDPMNPKEGFITSGDQSGYINIAAYDCDCNLIYSTVDMFSSDYYVHYSNKCNSSIQTFFVNTDDFPIGTKCIKFVVTVYGTDALGNKVVIDCKESEPYKNIDEYLEYDCKNTCLIEGTYNNTDCYGRCYCEEIENFVGTSNRQFFLSMRVHGSLAYKGDEKEEIENDDGERIGFQTVSSNEFVTASLVPPYYQKCISTLFCSDVVSVCGKQFDDIISSNVREDEESLYMCMRFGLNNYCSDSSDCN